MSDTTPTSEKPLWRRWGPTVLKVAVVVAVVAFVGQTVREALAELLERGLTIRPAPAVLAGLAIVTAQFPMAWFWRRTLLALGQPAPPMAAVRAYYLSQIGKYVPGKASVVLIRTERLLTAVHQAGGPQPQAACGRTVAAAVFYETLTHGAVGSLLAAALSATVLPEDQANRQLLILLSVGLTAVCVTPIAPPVFAWLLRRVANTPDALARQEANRLGYRLLGVGAASAALSWAMIGGVLWLAAMSVGAAGLSDLARAPLWVLAAALPTVAGFVSLLPAGVVVREALGLMILAPALGEANALAVTIAYRVIWVATEVVLCGSLVFSGFMGGSRAIHPERNPP